MVRKKALAALLLAFMPVLLMAQRIQPILEPTIMVKADVSDIDVKKVIERTLLTRGWRILALKDNEITARYQMRAMSTDIKFQFDREKILIKYVRSDNLKFKEKGDGAKMIHRDYNTWINEIHSDIEHALSLWR